ncbi:MULTISPECIES: ribonuclease H-like YkuK family protein [Bacillaceae]|uniref:Ribonuclease H-like YkuK family protein n=1 Tax=Evansella alkalicola TaxID=745819 RepID=A0ABS6JWE1_9BACI|nr:MULTISPECIES: ribonuclease H-like YkuK family protein [Bacillaceae]MBU9722900.1 ribonuclease H-like YkuK family protein [Bacillus alkalicola]
MRKLHALNYSFENSQEKNMTFEQVFQRILRFMKRDPKGNFRLMFGTDSQVHSTYTRFVTGVVIQQEGKGAWACIRKVVIPRQMKNLHEKISLETSLTEEIASMFTEERKDQLIDIVLPHIYKGASFTIEGHIDIGAQNRNKTRLYVREMVARIESMGLEPKIKPESYVASAYANRFTK